MNAEEKIPKLYFPNYGYLYRNIFCLIFLIYIEGKLLKIHKNEKTM